MPNEGLIKKICLELTNNPSNVDDHFQECLVNLFRYIHTYDPDRKLLTWIYICTKRHVIELEKKVARYKEDLIEPAKVHNKFTIIDDVSNELTMENYTNELSDECIVALDSMQPIYKNTFLMKLMGYKLKEIMDHEYKNGNLKHRNIETVKSRLFLARKHLQRHLSEFYDKG